MNNPYRARPTRTRIDPNTNYGIQDQASLQNSLPLQRPVAHVPTSKLLQRSSAAMNQSQSNDPWSWGSNGNNDSWNWSIDQNSETSQQQQEISHQFLPHSEVDNSQKNGQDMNYFQSLNGNNKADRKIPVINNVNTESSHPYQPNSFSQFSSTYSKNQQLSMVPNTQRSISTKTEVASAVLDNSQQWSTLQTQSIPSLQQNLQHQQNIQQNAEYNQRHAVVQPSLAETTSFNYKWTADQMNPSATQANYENHNENSSGSTFWKDQNVIKNDLYNENFDNQWFQQVQHLPQQNAPNLYPQQIQQSQIDTTIYEAIPQSNDLPTNHQRKKAHTDHFTNFLPRQQSLPSNPLSHLEEDSSNVQSKQAKLQTGGSLEESTSSETKSEWKPINVPPYFASSTTSTTSGSLANMSSSNEQLEDRKKSLTPGTSLTSLNDFSSQNNIEQSTPSNPFQNYTNAKTGNDWNAASTSDLASGISNLKLNQKSENQDTSVFKEVDVTAKEEIKSPKSDWVHNNATIKVENAIENDLLTGSKNLTEVSSSVIQQTIPQIETVESFDQWYNHNAVAVKSDENKWYNNEQSTLTKQWQPVNQNVENFENIQQSTDSINLEVVQPEIQQRDIYGSRESVNKETLDNEHFNNHNNITRESVIRDFRNEANNFEVPLASQSQPQKHTEQIPENYEFASNDRNTFLETGELTDPNSQDRNNIVPQNQDEENDEVPNDIPFLREVPGQSSNYDSRRNDPTGQEQYAQSTLRISETRSSQGNSTQSRNLVERRDVPSGQERINSSNVIQRNDIENLIERRNDPSGRERSVTPTQLSRNEPSGEERGVSANPSANIEMNSVREIPGRGNDLEENIQQVDTAVRQIPGGASPSDSMQVSNDRSNTRVVTGSQEVTIPPFSTSQDQLADNSRSKREEAVGASMSISAVASNSQNRRDSYQDGDDEESGNSPDDSRERRRDPSPKSRHSRYNYSRKSAYYDRDRDYYDDDSYYERRGEVDYDRREDIDSRYNREAFDWRSRKKDDVDVREERKKVSDRRRDRSDDSRRFDRDYDPRYARDRDYQDRDRDRDRRREDRRSRRYPDYEAHDSYRREHYDDGYNRNSRPHSRSSYNERDREYLRSRDQYSYGYPSYSSFDYGSNYSRDYYAYLENLRRTDPAAYTEWYHKYIQHQRQIARGANSTYPEDRASVHSGQSSCEERNSTDKRNMTETSLLEDQTVASARLTPTKFSTAHIRGSFAIGAMVHVHASYPTDGERARVDIIKLDSLLQNDVTLNELKIYPGPLIKGVTHKKKIIDYCESKIKKALSNVTLVDCSSYILLYELMIMLIQQNGKVVGVDIASLLLRNKDAFPYSPENNKTHRSSARKDSTISQRSAASGGDGRIASDDLSISEENMNPRKSVDQLTNEFRNKLLYGLVHEALEFAMAEGLWGHALFLASKLDKRTHASVMTRFANSLSVQDPLQTLYQLHSGRVPASVTCVSDAKWDDWRPHLAMIISNTSGNPEINCRSILVLGDTLAARGDIYAAHFCYILSQVDFGEYSTKSNGVKLVLIGANHNKPYSEFFNLESIMLTEIYEYARSLSESNFSLVDLQTFKFDLAVKMADCGLIEKSLLYIEQVALNIIEQPMKYKKTFINNVFTLGDKLKYQDPVFKDTVGDDITNLPWLDKLSEIIGKCELGEIIQDINDYINSDQNNMFEQPIQQNNHNLEVNETNLQESGANEMIWNPKNENAISSNKDITSSAYQNFPQTIDVRNEQMQYLNSQYQQDYWSQPAPYSQQDFNSRDYKQPDWQQTTSTDYRTENRASESTEDLNKWNQEPQQPTISMVPSGNKQFDPLEELESLEPSKSQPKKSQEVKKAQDKSQEKKNSNSSGGSWFGGLFSKLAPKPKNQMILPDDSNPSIVWDSNLKKWVNKEEDEDAGSSALAPPPKITETPGFRPSTAVAPSQSITAAPTTKMTMFDETTALNSSKMISSSSNMYKMPKSRNLRANYIDVMNPNSTKKDSTPTMNTGVTTASPSMPMATSSPQFFVPAQVNDPNAPVDFLTPVSSLAPRHSENPAHELSRWSSASSLSREVQSYTMKDVRHHRHGDKGALMYNPVNQKDPSQKGTPRSRFLQ